jgi:thiol-disulfide isomerase/thioredoxin
MSKSKKISGSAISVIILLVFIWTLVPFGSSSKKSVFAFDHTANEGYVAFIVNEYESEGVPDDEDESQECDGSGYITHGDGHKTPCPGCKNCGKSQSELGVSIVVDDVKKNSTQNTLGVNTPSQNMKQENLLVNGEAPSNTKVTQKQQPLTEQARNRQILLFTAYWCGPCQQFKNNEIPKFNMNPKWTVNESKNAHIRIVDVDKKENQPLMQKYKRSRVVPEFVKIINGKFVSNKTGFHTAKQIGEWYNNVR